MSNTAAVILRLTEPYQYIATKEYVSVYDEPLPIRGTLACIQPLNRVVRVRLLRSMKERERDEMIADAKELVREELIFALTQQGHPKEEAEAAILRFGKYEVRR